MLIRLDMASATPIYVQLRNQIVMGIGTGASVSYTHLRAHET